MGRKFPVLAVLTVALLSVLIAYCVPSNGSFNIIGLSLEVFLILVLFGGNLCKMRGKTLPLAFFLLFLFRACLLIYQSTHGDLPMAGSDIWVFHSNATNIVEHARSVIDILMPSEAIGNTGDFFERLVALIYYTFGRHTIYIYYWSFLASEVVCLFIYKCALLISGDRLIATKSALLFYCWPMEIIYSVAYLREMTIQMVFAASLYEFLKYLTQGKRSSFALALACSAVCAGMHSGMVSVLVSYLVVYSLYEYRSKKLKFSISKCVLFVVIMAVVMISPLWKVMTTRFAEFDSAASVMSYTGSVSGSTDYIGAANSSLELIIQLPIRLFYFVLAPLPWHVRSGGTLIAFFLDGIFRIWMVGRICANYRTLKHAYGFKYNLFMAGIIIYLITMFVFSWGTNNYGTAMRHRLKIFPLEILLAYTIVRIPVQEDGINFHNRGEIDEYKK